VTSQAPSRQRGGAFVILAPGNLHVKDKIRQQLQILRDAGLLLHIDRGLWRLP